MNIRVKEAKKLVKKEKETLAKPAAKTMIGQQVCPSNRYLAPSIFDAISLANIESYIRSDKSLLEKLRTKIEKLQYPGKVGNGNRAHAGAYTNIYEAIGDTLSPGQAPFNTTQGDAILYDDLLKYKKDLCNQFVSDFPKDEAKHINVGYYNEYPCIMVHLKTTSIVQYDKNAVVTDAAREGWSSLLSSFFVGYLNFLAYKNGIPFEMERRSSFGFHVPTVAVTGESLRINLSLVPKEYCKLVEEALIGLDELIAKLHAIKDKFEVAKYPGIFYNTEKYKKYTENKKKDVDIKPNINLVQLLWEKVEHSANYSKTLLQNLARTGYMRHSMGVKVANFCKQNPTNTNLVFRAFMESLQWAYDHVNIRGDAKSLSVDTKETAPTYDFDFITNPSIQIQDESYWDILKKIKKQVKLDNAVSKEGVKWLKEGIAAKKVDLITVALDLVNQGFLIEASNTVAQVNLSDGCGSDSEAEEDVEDKKIYGKKIISNNGMRAFTNTTRAIRRFLKEADVKDEKIYERSAYYETRDAVKCTFEAKDKVKCVNKVSDANVIVHDINACVTNGKNDISDSKSLFHKDCILILDSTSSGTKEVHHYLKKFAKSDGDVLFVIESGLKHQQNGSDNNPYGAIRIFSKDKALRDKYYAFFKEQKNEGIDSAISHRLRQLMKEKGFVPTTKSMLRG